MGLAKRGLLRILAQFFHTVMEWGQLTPRLDGCSIRQPGFAQKFRVVIEN